MKCSKVLKNGSTCKNNTKDNSFFCPKHYETMYGVNDFCLLHEVKNVDTLREILKDGSLKANSLTGNRNYDRDFNIIFMSLLSPDNLLIFGERSFKYISGSDEDDGIHHYKFKNTYLVFKPEILMHVDSHISAVWNWGEMDEESESYKTIENLSHKENLRENLNFWNERLKFINFEFSEDESIPNEVVLKTEIINLSYMKAIYYPKNIYEKVVFKNNLILCGEEDYKKFVKSYMKLYEKYKDIYRWILNGNKSFLKKYI